MTGASPTMRKGPGASVGLADATVAAEALGSVDPTGAVVVGVADGPGPQAATRRISAASGGSHRRLAGGPIRGSLGNQKTPDGSISLPAPVRRPG
jgi:hypothetical protein